MLRKKYHILMIEENPAEVKLITECLNLLKYHYDLQVARTADEALSAIKRGGTFPDSGKPDLILSSMKVPGIKASELLREIKAGEALASIPFVILSFSDSPQDIQECYQLGASAVVYKPPDFGQLLKKIKSIFELLQ